MSGIRILDGSGVPTSAAGGKGAALDRLIGLGADVPPTAMLPTDVYRRYADHHGLDARLRALVGGDRASADEIDELFLALELPDDLRAEVLAIADEVRGDGLVAVRSSATAEDLAAASFAGQYRSLLELSGDDEIDRAVRLV